MKKACYVCLSEIKDKENHASLNSHSNGKIIHTDYFHANCWKYFIEKRLDDKVKEYASKMMETAVPIIKEKMVL